MSNHTRTTSFQFHKGTIKTTRHSEVNPLQVDFNSIKVQLKQSAFYLKINGFLLFQFHKGTIKTLIQKQNFLCFYYFNSIKVQLKPRIAAAHRPPRQFQFHKGTIKTRTSASPPFTMQISIP